MLVIDASALIELLTVDPGANPELVRRVTQVDWIGAPDLIDYEVLNVLRRMVIGGHIAAESAESARHAVCDL